MSAIGGESSSGVGGFADRPTETACRRRIQNNVACRSKIEEHGATFK
jgi:hypothetical protein